MLGRSQNCLFTEPKDAIFLQLGSPPTPPQQRRGHQYFITKAKHPAFTTVKPNTTAKTSFSAGPKDKPTDASLASSV
jgi:hypothetical protein